jgi:diaminopimelate epimerase
VRFTKGHGTGNDFVILPDPDGRVALTPALVAALCDRRRGIGADGVLRVIRSAKHPEAAGMAAEAEWFMDYWNSDGSPAEMCGNGTRVFVRYLLADGLATGSSVPLATRSGVVRAVVRDSGEIAVDLGAPRVYGSSTAAVGALTMPGVAVDCGNPHLVCGLHGGRPLTDLDLTRAPGFDATFFPSGVNVEFVVPAPALSDVAPSDVVVSDVDVHVAMRVYERGSGETLSCGTGAVAVAAVALRDAGLADGTVAVDVPGGRLTVTFDGASCWLAGPAVLVATGEVDPAALRD